MSFLLRSILKTSVHNMISSELREEFTSLLHAHVPSLHITSSQATGHVPWREDAHPSLSADLEKCVWYDLARKEGGGVKEFKARLGLNGGKQQARKNVATYDYHNESGTLLFQVLRFEPKDFRQRRPDGNGRWIWSLNGVKRALYRLPEILVSQTVYLVEGEKDADRLWSLGLPATTCPGGAGKWRDEYSEMLANKRAVILPDNDEAGGQHALTVAQSLLPVAAAVKIVRLPELPLKGDVSDWLNAGHTKEELVAIVQATPILNSEQPKLWPVPEPLPRGLLPVPSLAEVMIPEPLRPWLCDIAERMQCPPEFPVVGTLVSLAALVGRRIGIRPKKYDDWLVIPNLWGAVIGRPGIMKTPALAEAMKPLRRLEVQARAAYEQELKKWEFSKLVVKAEKEDMERKIRETVKKGNDPEQVRSSMPESEEEPLLGRNLVNDSTVEKLGVILNQNPRGILLFRDELTGWLKTLDREGHENDRAFYLEAWNGNSSYTYDRIGRGTLYIQAACVSIMGGIQPGPLAEYLRAAVKGGGDDDGLMQRFQLAVYPDDPGDWRNVDRWPDSQAKNRAFALFEKLDKLDPATIGAQIGEGEETPFLRFSLGAQELFDGWRSDLEHKIRARDEDPVLEAHLAKYRSLMPSLALLFHLLEVVDNLAEGTVSERTAQMAAAWCDFLEAHARRIYQSVTQQSLFAARRLAERIKEKAVPNPFTARDVYRKQWSGLTDLDDVRAAIGILEDLDWVQSEKLLTLGRTKLQYHINPQLQGEEKDAAKIPIPLPRRTDRTDKSPFCQL